MIRTFFIACSLAAFSLTALPVIATQAGVEGWSAEAARYHHRKHYRKHAVRGKYQYQYVPTSSGRAGAWR